MRKIKDCYEKADLANKPFYEESAFYVNEFIVEVSCLGRNLWTNRRRQRLELHNGNIGSKYRRIKPSKDAKQQS